VIKRCPEHGYFRGESCECGNPGQVVLEDERSEKLGRLVAGALRHFPGDLGLDMDPRGWVDLEDLSEAIATRYRWANKRLVISLVQSDPKERYEIREGRIRAKYGHSVEVNLDYPRNELPALYYGANEEEAGRILEVGLKAATQRYVHLSTTPEKAWYVGTFRTNSPRVIRVDAQAAQRAGVKMMEVSENIVISENVPPEHLRLVPFAKPDLEG
jgi:putative RNA 2'-phosphotransferase